MERIGYVLIFVFFVVVDAKPRIVGHRMSMVFITGGIPTAVELVEFER